MKIYRLKGGRPVERLELRPVVGQPNLAYEVKSLPFKAKPRKHHGHAWRRWIALTEEERQAIRQRADRLI